MTPVNPDPFAATATCDPFQSKMVWLDRRADEFELNMKKWLNALVSIPVDPDTEPTQPLDVGKLFDEVKSKELTLAPTKELIACKYYRYKLGSLRSAGIALYRSEEVAAPLRRVALQVEKQLLTLRTDRSLHLDLVLQQNILDLLLCFNPLWLRLGLEVVYGEQIELQPNRDVVGLSAFIIHRLFRDRQLEACNAQSYKLSTAYAEHMQKFTLRTVLCLLLFLDTAKRRKLIKHNPCLFERSAPYKETREILVRFSSNLVSGVGDITKHLRRVGYTLSHKQRFLDEYDYAFEDLAVDLRDGVRLTRVVEFILLREDLSPRLSVPPTARVQKIHNVNLALGALEQAEFRIAGDITARDISDGHREQTMSLLWQIVQMFRAPKLESAAIAIINRRVEEKRCVRREAAARTIQAAVRRRFVRARYEAIRLYVRNYSAQRLAARRCGAVVRIQQWWRAVRVVRQTRERYLLWQKSALVLQRSYRRFALARKLLAVAGAISAIRAEAKHRDRLASIIQRCFKSFVIRRRLQAVVPGILAISRRDALRNRSAAIIQSHWRMKATRTEFLRARSATLCIQRRWRECMEAGSTRNQFVLMRRSAIVLQRHARGWMQMRQDRRRYERTRQLIVQVQHLWRATMAMRTERSCYATLRRVTIAVQRRYRARLATRQAVQRYVTLRYVTSRLQRRYRANRAMAEQRRLFCRLRVAALCLQRCYRARLSMRAARAAYATVRCAIVKIQVHYRATVRMRPARARFLALRRSAVIVQVRFRAILAGRLARRRYEATRRTVIALQRSWRARLSERKRRAEAARCVQAWWRGAHYRKRFQNAVLRKIAQRMVASRRLARLQPANRLGNIHRLCMRFLQNPFSSTESVRILQQLERTSRLVPHILINDAIFLGVFCYETMAQSIRSEVDKI
uniref:Calponin-homology (CH) domain-containing protein n=1 Tax=Anopheles dirus TaxID=7168 RepID=A0A182NAD0_9DIPT